MKRNEELLENAKARSGSKWYLIKKSAVSCCKNILLPAFIFYILLAYVFGVAIVNGISMKPTLQDRSIVVMRRVGADKPSRGDIVVFRSDTYNNGENLIKRVIAIGGDTIDIDSDTGVVYINGEQIDEPYINNSATYGSFGVKMPLVVPDDCVFVMGDNRGCSVDSRFAVIGCVPKEKIIGIILFKG